MPKYLPILFLSLFAMAFASQAQRPWQLFAPNDTSNFINANTGVVFSMIPEEPSSSYPIDYSMNPVLSALDRNYNFIADSNLFAEYSKINDSMEDVRQGELWTFILNAKVGDTLCQSPSGDVGVIIAETERLIFNSQDSVKTAILSDGDTLEISKSNGLIRWGDYHLVGIEGQGKGISRPNWMDFIPFSTGDSIYYYKSQYIWRTGNAETKSLIIIDSVWNSGSGILVKVSGYERWQVFLAGQDVTSTINSTIELKKWQFFIPASQLNCSDTFTPYSGSYFHMKNDYIVPVKWRYLDSTFHLDGYKGNRMQSTYNGCFDPIQNLPLGDTLALHSQYAQPFLSCFKTFKIDTLGVYKVNYQCMSGNFTWTRMGYRSVSNPENNHGSMPGIGTFMSIEDFSHSSFSLFPNPTSSTLRLSYPEAFDEAQVAIYNMLGQVVSNSVIYEQESDLDVSELSEGYYILEMQLDKQVMRERLLVSD